MTDDDEDRLRRWQHWAETELPVYRVTDWDGTWSLAGDGNLIEIGPGGEAGQRVTMSRSVRHRDRDDPGRSLTVTSHRPDDAARLRMHAPANIAMAAVRQQLGPDVGAGRFNQAVERLRKQVAAGVIPWTATNFTVDGQEVAFDVVVLGPFWAAVGVLDTLHLTVDARHVPVAGYRLERIVDPPPPAPLPPGFGQRPKPRARAFPKAALQGPTSLPRPEHPVVDLVYGNSKEVTGTWAGQPVVITMNLPGSRAAASGMVGGQELRASLSVGDNSSTDPDVPATLEGQLAGQSVALTGRFHLDGDYRFEHGDFRGHVGSRLLEAHVEALDGGLSATGTVSVDGALGDDTFSVLATVAGDLSKAVVHGAVAGRPLHLEARIRRSAPRTVRIRGDYEGPPALLALIVGAVLFFV